MMEPIRIDNVLDDEHSYVELVDYMGGDLATVNGARASYNRQVETVGAKDKKLIDYLGDNQHHTPLRHTYYQLRIKAPEFVARQMFKHQIGCEYSFKDLPWSEFSQRYSEVQPEFYLPMKLRSPDPANKQGSIPFEGEANPELLRAQMEKSMLASYGHYKALLDANVTREIARTVLPTSFYTEWVYTASIQALTHLCVLREHPHAQLEIQQYAHAIRALCQPFAEYTWETLTSNHPMSVRVE